jgi:small subunit ribosomal protein S8e
MKQGKKISGGRYIKSRKKKLYERKGQERVVKLGEEKRKMMRVVGGNMRTSLLKGKFVNVVSNEHPGAIKKIEIKNVLETPSNKFLARQNILTKGTIVQTELGKVRITSRPSQEGGINGVLVE